LQRMFKFSGFYDQYPLKAQILCLTNRWRETHKHVQGFIINHLGLQPLPYKKLSSIINNDKSRVEILYYSKIPRTIRLS
jgi:hypothetical protein